MIAPAGLGLASCEQVRRTFDFAPQHNEARCPMLSRNEHKHPERPREIHQPAQTVPHVDPLADASLHLVTFSKTDNETENVRIVFTNSFCAQSRGDDVLLVGYFGPQGTWLVAFGRGERQELRDVEMTSTTISSKR